MNNVERILKALERHSKAKDRLTARASEYAVCFALNKKNQLVPGELEKAQERLLATARAYSRTIVSLPDEA